MDRNCVGSDSNCVCFSGYDYYTDDDKCCCKENEETKKEKETMSKEKGETVTFNDIFML